LKRLLTFVALVVAFLTLLGVVEWLRGERPGGSEHVTIGPPSGAPAPNPEPQTDRRPPAADTASPAEAGSPVHEEGEVGAPLQEEKAKEMTLLHDDLAEALGARPGVRWTHCEGDRCAAFLEVTGYTGGFKRPVFQKLARELGPGLPLPYEMVFGDEDRWTFVFGDRGVARSEAQAVEDARIISNLMEAGYTEEEILEGFETMEVIETRLPDTPRNR